MSISEYIKIILDLTDVDIIESSMLYDDELHIKVDGGNFAKVCNLLHESLPSPVMMLFAEDMVSISGKFVLYCAFLDAEKRSWIFVRQDIAGDKGTFGSISKDMYSASLFEREIKEMFGIEPAGNPDLRSLRLHEEVWPKESHPLRKDFAVKRPSSFKGAKYEFRRVEGEGIFEVPVGPVHAGIIGPGHFRFSAAGEPIINLETRLGWTHRGIEKLLEGKDLASSVKIFECISGDTAFGYSLAFCHSIEKICAIIVPERAKLIRALFLELERIYNHVNDIGGIALDVGFTFPAQFASLIKEKALQLNEALSASRYLKGINTIGGVARDIDASQVLLLRERLPVIKKDIMTLEKLLFSNVSFMDRVDATGILRTRTARDLGVTGVAARASGIGHDLRKIFPGIYKTLNFNVQKEHPGDVAARLKVRFGEVKVSMDLVQECLEKLANSPDQLIGPVDTKEGFGLGYAECWRGPVLVWTRLDGKGRIARCKIVDPSFHNWEGLSFAVLGNIIPDFPLCNKSFDLSYSGNDL